MKTSKIEGSSNEEWGCKIDIGFKQWKLQVSSRAPVDNSYSNVAGSSRKKVILKEITADCQSIKDLQKVQTAFLKCTNTLT